MKTYAIIIALLLSYSILNAQQTEKEITSKKLNHLLDQTKISGQWFIGHQYNRAGDINKFSLKRGYFTFKTQLNDVFSVRYTQDITLDQEGEDIGNVEMRLKYLYISMHPFNTGIFQDSYFEFGMIHRPWLDYEQSINGYRVQGTMFAERYDLINSADFGMNFTGYIGGKLSPESLKKHDMESAGRYGSYSLGIYNGPGYHAAEHNNNKTVEGRLSLRPLPNALPGIRASYAFVWGKANIPDNVADFNMNLFFISSESRFHNLTLQYLLGNGNSSGTYYIPPVNDDYETEGISAFGELQHPNWNISLFGRYDYFNLESPEELPQSPLNSLTRETFIAGIAYKFLKNKVVIDYNLGKNEDNVNREFLEVALEIKF